MRVAVMGTVFSGMGKGSYYVGHPGYQRRFKEALGYAPYPGTLNVKLDAESMEKVRQVRASGGTRVYGFTEGRESFSGLSCFDGELMGVEVALLFIDVTYYNETVAELISPEYLRGRLGLKDGDKVTFAVEAPGLRGKP
jgi:riboflavin kinase, archaea type